MGCPHTEVTMGKRVKIKLKYGIEIEDIFIERKSKFIILKEYGRLDKCRIKYMKIIKGVKHDNMH